MYGIGFIGESTGRYMFNKGVELYLIPATNLPEDSNIKWWAHPVIPDDLNWTEDKLEQARGIGIGMETDDVTRVRWTRK